MTFLSPMGEESVRDFSRKDGMEREVVFFDLF
jgi:hypothetical protein